MKTFNEIILFILGCAFLYCICFIPFESHYEITKVNEETKMMNIRYSSLVPFIKKDTCVKMPTYFYGQVLYNYYEKKDDKIIYRIAIKTNKEIYTYKDINTYHYVKEFTVGKDSIKLIEVYWPSHYIKTIPFNIYGKE